MVSCNFNEPNLLVQNEIDAYRFAYGYANSLSEISDSTELNCTYVEFEDDEFGKIRCNFPDSFMNAVHDGIQDGQKGRPSKY